MVRSTGVQWKASPATGMPVSRSLNAVADAFAGPASAPIAHTADIAPSATTPILRLFLMGPPVGSQPHAQRVRLVPGTLCSRRVMEKGANTTLAQMQDERTGHTARAPTEGGSTAGRGRRGVMATPRPDPGATPSARRG